MTRFWHWLAARVLAWSTRRLDRQGRAAKLRAFPVGSRIMVGGGCACGRKFVGRLGTVAGLTSGGEDYVVHVDGDVYEPDARYPSLVGCQRDEYMCPSAMVPARAMSDYLVRRGRG